MAGIGALFVAFLLLQVGNGLQRILLPLRAEAEGFTALAMGLVMAAHFSGYLVGARIIRTMLTSVGHIRAFAALASTASAAVLVNAVIVLPVSWMLVYFIGGICNAGVFVVLESWLNDRASNETRGKILGWYMMIMMGGTAGGLLLVNLGSAEGFEMFVLSSVLISAAVIPVTLSASSAPPMPSTEQMSIKELYRLVPSAVVGLFLASFVQASASSMSSVYGTESGMSGSQVALFAAAGVSGAVLLQVPLGKLSDRYPRRSVIMVVAITAGAVALFATTVEPTGWLIISANFTFGAFVFPLYGLFVALANDWVPTEKRTAAASALVLTSSFGAVASPMVTSMAMRALGPAGYYWTFAAVMGILVVYLSYGIKVRDAVPVERQSKFQPLGARSGEMAHAVGRWVRKPVLRKKPTTGEKK